MISSRALIDYLVAKGIAFYSGVPCSILKPLLNCIETYSGIEYYSAVNENVAIGIASGASVAGRKSAIFIQNSGLGNIVNPLTSFNQIYKVPMLMFITWRGYLGKDAPEHLIMGKIMPELLDCLKIPSVILTDDFCKDIDQALDYMNKSQSPVAVIVKDGLLE